MYHQRVSTIRNTLFFLKHINRKCYLWAQLWQLLHGSRTKSIITDWGRRELLYHFPNWTYPGKSDPRWKLPAPAVHSTLGFTIFVWETTHKDFSFCLLTEQRYVHTLLKYESLHMPVLACCIIRVKLGMTLQYQLSSPRITFKNLILIHILRKLETCLYFSCKIR